MSASSPVEPCVRPEKRPMKIGDRTTVGNWFVMSMDGSMIQCFTILPQILPDPHPVGYWQVRKVCGVPAGLQRLRSTGKSATGAALDSNRSSVCG